VEFITLHQLSLKILNKVLTYKLIPALAKFRMMGEATFHDIEAKVVAGFDGRNALTS
jgi:hypothetical protein